VDKVTHGSEHLAAAEVETAGTRFCFFYLEDFGSVIGVRGLGIGDLVLDLGSTFRIRIPIRTRSR